MATRSSATSPLLWARLAGILYLCLVPLSVLGFPYGPSRFFVPGDPAATANNIMASALAFRFSIVVNLLGAIVNSLVVLALFKLLKPVNRNIASLMVVFLLLAVPIQMLNELNHVAILLILGNTGYMAAFSTGQLQALVLLFHDLHRYGLSIAQTFWGLWLLPMGYLVFKSRFIPWVLGILMIIGGLGWLAVSLSALLLPALRVDFLTVTAIGEILLPLWLVIKGVNVEQWEQRAREAAAQGN